MLKSNFINHTISFDRLFIFLIVRYSLRHKLTHKFINKFIFVFDFFQRLLLLYQMLTGTFTLHTLIDLLSLLKKLRELLRQFGESVKRFSHFMNHSNIHLYIQSFSDIGIEPTTEIALSSCLFKPSSIPT